MMSVEAERRLRRPVDFKAAGGGVGPGDLGLRLGRREAAGREIEGIPAESQSVTQQDDDQESRRRQERPAERRKGAQEGSRGHGKTFRSSSKCGPSRRVAQSPPQTMAVPWRTAAALKAAAMRG